MTAAGPTFDMGRSQRIAQRVKDSLAAGAAIAKRSAARLVRGSQPSQPSQDAAAALLEDAGQGRTAAETEKFYRSLAAKQGDKLGGVSAEERERLVGEVVRYALMHYGRHGGAPIKREELNALVSKDYKEKSKRGLGKAVIAQAQLVLPATFGLELREVAKERVVRNTEAERTRQVRGGEAHVVNAYYLRSALPSQLRAYVETEEDRAWQGLTLAVVCLIHMAGGAMSEDTLKGYLADLGVRPRQLGHSGPHHPTFGAPDNVLERLLRLRYLMKAKQTHTDADQTGEFWEFYLAENATKNIGTERTAEAIAAILEKDLGAVREPGLGQGLTQLI